MFRMPNTDPSRTNDRTTTPFSPSTVHTINLSSLLPSFALTHSLSLSLPFPPSSPSSFVYLANSPSFSTVPLGGTARVGGVHPLPRTFRISLMLSSSTSSHLLPRPDQPFLSEIFRRPRACTSLHLTPRSSSAEHVRRPIPGTCSTLPLALFFSRSCGG